MCSAVCEAKHVAMCNMVFLEHRLDQLNVKMMGQHCMTKGDGTTETKDPRKTLQDYVSEDTERCGLSLRGCTS